MTVNRVQWVSTTLSATSALHARKASFARELDLNHSRASLEHTALIKVWHILLRVPTTRIPTHLAMLTARVAQSALIILCLIALT